MSVVVATGEAEAQAEVGAAADAAGLVADRRVRSNRRGWSLRRLATALFAGLAILVLVAVALVTVALVRLVSAVDVQTRQYGPAVIRASAANLALVDQETGVRGYAITGDESYLEPYTAGLVTEATNIAQLRDVLPAEDTTSRAAVDALEVAAGAWRSEFAEPVVTATRAGDRAQVTVLLEGATSNGKALFDDVRAAYAALTDDVTARRSDAVERVRGAVSLIVWTVVVVAPIVLIGALVAWWGVRRRVVRPISRLAAESRIVAAGGYAHRVAGGGPAEIDDLAQDVEAMRVRVVSELAEVEAARAQAERTGASLARSNADLEQFAYVASHDLQEPLRKVSNFCQLLERQYSADLDDRARQYIDFAVDGAKRMQVLINDLLSFSRVGRNADSFAEVDLADVVREALDNLAVPLQDSGGTVHVAPTMPTLRGDRTLLVTLLQNLVGNSVKYHGEDLPRIEVAAHRRIAHDPLGADGREPRHEWVVSVEDNGIGIEPQYAQRIFVIFQRLHLRDSYGGTGIGLAMCKKIVEFHGGVIWLEPTDSPGARFCFTLPEGTTS